MSTDRMISGTELVDQFEVSGNYLLITSFNDPWDRWTELTLLDEQLYVISRRTLGKETLIFKRRPFSVKSIQTLSENSLSLIGSSEEDGIYSVEILEKNGIPLLRQRIKVFWQPALQS